MRKIFLTTICTFLLLTGCTNEVLDETESTQTTDVDTTTSNLETESDVSKEDTNSETITFGDTITTDGNASINDNQVSITTGGNYVLTGTKSDTQVTVNAPGEDVYIELNNLDLTSTSTSAITVIDADHVYFTLVGTSYLTDSVNNNDENQAPLYIDEVKTYIDGDGTLNLTGNYQEGLECNNDLFIEGGTLNIVAVDDGINAGDLLDISGGSININSGGDGLDSNGDLVISGGDIFVSSGNNANGPIDFGDGDYTFELTGGNIIAMGGNMGTTPSSNTQTFLNGTSSGTTISVDGTEYEAPKSFSYFFISTPNLTEDSTIEVDGSTVNASSSASGQMGGQMGGQPGEMQPRM